MKKLIVILLLAIAAATASLQPETPRHAATARRSNNVLHPAATYPISPETTGRSAADSPWNPGDAMDRPERAGRRENVTIYRKHHY